MFSHILRSSWLYYRFTRTHREIKVVAVGVHMPHLYGVGGGELLKMDDFDNVVFDVVKEILFYARSLCIL